LRDIILLLDAKYRVVSDDAYVQKYRAPGPPVDAINQMHRYRDAILIGAGPTRYRPTVRAVAIFPLNPESNTRFESQVFCRSLEDVGIGALPYLPSNKGLLHDWLATTLLSSNKDIAWPGPPFGAWFDLSEY